MRTRRSRFLGLVAGIAAVAFVAPAAIGAMSGGPTPANKATAAGSTLKQFPAGPEVELLSATLRTSKPTDLLLQTSLECSILTKLQTGPEAPPPPPAPGDPPPPPAIDSAKAHASIRGWIEIDDDPANNEAVETGAPERVVSVVSSSAPPQNGATPNSGDRVKDSATFCDRTYERTVEDGEDPLDGIDRETDYIDTKSANAFNWVLLNAGSGVKYVRLVAELVGGAEGTCPRETTTPMAASSCTEAYVGNRTMIIEPTKMANDAVVNNPGS